MASKYVMEDMYGFLCLGKPASPGYLTVFIQKFLSLKKTLLVPSIAERGEPPAVTMDPLLFNLVSAKRALNTIKNTTFSQSLAPWKSNISRRSWLESLLLLAKGKSCVWYLGGPPPTWPHLTLLQLLLSVALMARSALLATGVGSPPYMWGSALPFHFFLQKPTLGISNFLYDPTENNSAMSRPGQKQQHQPVQFIERSL